MTRDQIADATGWYGSAAILTAYFLLVNDTLSNDSIAYLLLNITGSLGLAYLALVKHARPAVLLNVVWAMIGLAGFVV
jgi:hypothetical protein